MKQAEALRLADRLDANLGDTRRVRALWNGGTMFDGLTWNEFGGYYEGDAWAARGNEIERREQQEEREHAAMERNDVDRPRIAEPAQSGQPVRGGRNNKDSLD